MSIAEPKTATLAELAALIDGRVVGDENFRVLRVAPINAAREGDITFVANPKYIAATRCEMRNKKANAKTIIHVISVLRNSDKKAVKNNGIVNPKTTNMNTHLSFLGRQ